MRGKPIVYETTNTGCIVPTSHKLNADGYFRTRDDRFTGSGRKPLIMNHRLVWEKAHGPIPDGHEVNHMCGNRACCNLEHLEVLDRNTHLVMTNEERSAPRRAEAKIYWLNTRCTGTHLGEQFGVSFSVACRWIREWKV